MPAIIPPDTQILDLFGEHANHPGRYAYAVMGALLDRMESAMASGISPEQVIALARQDLEAATGEPVRKVINLDEFLVPSRKEDVLAAARKLGYEAPRPLSP